MLQETFADFEATAKETSSSLNATMSFVYAPLSAQFAQLTKSLGGPTPLNIPVVSQNCKFYPLLFPYPSFFNTEKREGGTNQVDLYRAQCGNPMA